LLASFIAKDQTDFQATQDIVKGEI
jgi:hypothetical protein